jgi:hypothetical protein
MKKLLYGTILLALLFVFPMAAMAQVSVRVSIPLPPLIMFPAPPVLVVIPETYVYVVPDVQEEIFFYNGWWWRPWNGRWYRARNYDRGWVYYKRVPSFYGRIPSGWRNDYREHRWQGHQWNYQRIPHQQLHNNWRGWQKNKHWEKQQTWGVQGLRPQPQSPKQGRQQQLHPQSREVKPVQNVRTPSEPRQPREAKQGKEAKHQGRQEKDKEEKHEKR